jgi:hypothetical protein
MCFLHIPLIGRVRAPKEKNFYVALGQRGPCPWRPSASAFSELAGCFNLKGKLQDSHLMLNVGVVDCSCPAKAADRRGAVGPIWCFRKGWRHRQRAGFGGAPQLRGCLILRHAPVDMGFPCCWWFYQDCCVVQGFNCTKTVVF